MPAKPFVPTDEQRDLVCLFVACGISEQIIAEQVGIARETLRKQFREELTRGRELALAKNLARLSKAAESGNVTAQKYLDSRIAVSAAAQAWEAETVVVRKSPPKLGKKEQAQAAAATAGEGSEWGSDLRTDRNLPN